MNPIERLQEQLQQYLKKGKYNLHPPLRPEDTWTLDIDCDSKHYVVDWTPPNRFGVSHVTEGSPFGSGPEEEFLNIRDTFSRLLTLLAPPLKGGTVSQESEELKARIEKWRLRAYGILKDKDLQEVDQWIPEGPADTMVPYLEALVWELQALRNEKANRLSTLNGIDQVSGKHGGAICMKGHRIPMSQVVAFLAQEGKTLTDFADDFDLDATELRWALEDTAQLLERLKLSDSDD